MADEFDRTCWRGIRIDHPAQWELAVASRVDQPGRCTFCDRHYQRLDVRWRGLKYVPKPELLLDKARRPANGPEGGTTCSDLTGAPRDWSGVVRRTPEGWIVYAVRFFRAERMLVEATLVWPGRRNTSLEKDVLSGIAPEGPPPGEAGMRHWWAMGLRVDLDARWKLQTVSAKVGRVKWRFVPTDPGSRRGRKPPPDSVARRKADLAVERIAMPKYWLKGPLRDWLNELIGPDIQVLHQGVRDYNSHRAERLTTRSPADKLSRLRGLWNLRTDVAWRCPVEHRIYHVCYSEIARAEELSLPESLKIYCCRPPPALVSRRAGKPRAAARGGENE